MKRTPKKLQLNLVTLRTLQLLGDKELGQVVGGQKGNSGVAQCTNTSNRTW